MFKRPPSPKAQRQEQEGKQAPPNAFSAMVRGARGAAAGPASGAAPSSAGKGGAAPASGRGTSPTRRGKRELGPLPGPVAELVLKAKESPAHMALLLGAGCFALAVLKAVFFRGRSKPKEPRQQRLQSPDSALDALAETPQQERRVSKDLAYLLDPSRSPLADSALRGRYGGMEDRLAPSQDGDARALRSIAGECCSASCACRRETQQAVQDTILSLKDDLLAMAERDGEGQTGVNLSVVALEKAVAELRKNVHMVEERVEVTDQQMEASHGALSLLRTQRKEDLHAVRTQRETDRQQREAEFASVRGRLEDAEREWRAGLVALKEEQDQALRVLRTEVLGLLGAKADSADLDGACASLKQCQEDLGEQKSLVEALKGQVAALEQQLKEDKAQAAADRERVLVELQSAERRIKATEDRVEAVQSGVLSQVEAKFEDVQKRVASAEDSIALEAQSTAALEGKVLEQLAHKVKKAEERNVEALADLEQKLTGRIEAVSDRMQAGDVGVSVATVAISASGSKEKERGRRDAGSEWKGEVAGLRREVKDLASEWKGELGSVRKELKELAAESRSEAGGAKKEMKELGAAQGKLREGVERLQGQMRKAEEELGKRRGAHEQLQGSVEKLAKQVKGTGSKKDREAAAAEWEELLQSVEVKVKRAEERAKEIEERMLALERQQQQQQEEEELRPKQEEDTEALSKEGRSLAGANAAEPSTTPSDGSADVALAPKLSVAHEASSALDEFQGRVQAVEQGLAEVKEQLAGSGAAAEALVAKAQSSVMAVVQEESSARADALEGLKAQVLEEASAGLAGLQTEFRTLQESHEEHDERLVSAEAQLLRLGREVGRVEQEWRREVEGGKQLLLEQGERMKAAVAGIREEYDVRQEHVHSCLVELEEQQGRHGDALAALQRKVEDALEDLEAKLGQWSSQLASVRERQGQVEGLVEGLQGEVAAEHQRSEERAGEEELRKFEEEQRMAALEGVVGELEVRHEATAEELRRVEEERSASAAKMLGVLQGDVRRLVERLEVVVREEQAEVRKEVGDGMSTLTQRLQRLEQKWAQNQELLVASVEDCTKGLHKNMRELQESRQHWQHLEFELSTLTAAHGELQASLTEKKPKGKILRWNTAGRGGSPASSTTTLDIKTHTGPSSEASTPRAYRGSYGPPSPDISPFTRSQEFSKGESRKPAGWLRRKEIVRTLSATANSNSTNDLTDF